MQNISSGGVGEAYPGSNGGEIFNCYEGTNRNLALGTYSTAVGIGNKTYGAASFTFGSNNSNEGTYCIVGGVNNIMPNTGSYRCIFGGYNRLQYPGFVIGYNNNSSGYIIGENNTNGYSTSINGILIGYGLLHRNQRNNYSTPDKVIAIGQYNASTALASPILMIGCGQDTLNPKNALEINASSCKILNNFQLNTDSTEVDQITAPQDPNNITQDDKTLATKSYVASQVPSLTALQGITFKRTYTAVTGQITTLTPNTDNNLETLFSITIPSWATHMKIGYDISMMQGYVYMNLGVSGVYPIIMPDQDTSEIYSFSLGWEPSTKELYVSYGHIWTAGIPAADPNLIFSIMSIRFEGDYTPFPVNP